MLKGINKISILGCERSGLAAAIAAKKLGYNPFVSDIKEISSASDVINRLNKYNIEYEFGTHSDKVLEADLVIKSPGVPNNAEIIKRIKSKGIKIISEIEFAFNHSEIPVIGITGTNGKTTTTSLCNFLLKTAGLRSVAAGNIGLPYSEVIFEDLDYIVLELSSFQLDDIDRFKPYIAIILNIKPDHLNRYDFKYELYRSAKLNITKNSDQNSWVILNDDDQYLAEEKEKIESKIITFSTKDKSLKGISFKDNNIYFDEELVCTRKDLQLDGEHNLSNAMSVIAVAKILGISNSVIKKTLNGFKAIEHRLELVLENDGVKYINDSKATNVDAVYYALGSYKNIHLILGGLDKGNDYNQIKELVLERCKKVYAIGESAKKVFQFFSEIIDTEITSDLRSTLERIKENVDVGDVVLLSPACASFDQFESYEERGKVFKQLVKEII